MWNIMRSEFYKVRKSKVTWVTFFIILGMAIISSGATIYGKIAGGMWADVMKNKGISVFASFPNGTLYFVLVAIFVGGLVTGEYTTGTVKQVVSRGVSRTQIVIGQFVALSVAITLITLIPAALQCVVFSICWGFGKISAARFLLLITGQIVVMCSYAAISTLIAHITRTGGLAIGINIVILLIGTSAAAVLAMLTKVDAFLEYWLTVMQSAALTYTGSSAEQAKFIGILFLLGVVCAGCSVLLFRKRDIQ